MADKELQSPSQPVVAEAAPYEPTEEMLDAAWKMTGYSKEMRPRVHALYKRFWQAMYEAAHPQASPPPVQSGPAFSQIPPENISNGQPGNEKANSVQSEVTQADRELYAGIILQLSGNEVLAEDARKGIDDDDYAMGLIVAHRLAHSQPDTQEGEHG